MLNPLPEMKITGILMSTPMAAATEQDLKTVTRRIVKLPEHDQMHWKEFGVFENTPEGFIEGRGLFKGKEDKMLSFYFASPYGYAGDVLYVRESFYAYGKWEIDGTTKNGKPSFSFIDQTEKFGKSYLYVAGEGEKPTQILTNRRDGLGWYQRPSMFMPMSAVRQWLEITEVRIELLQEIDEADSLKEGVDREHNKYYDREMYRDYNESEALFFSCRKARDSYHTLWMKINGTESWGKNPPVWVVRFKKTMKPSVK